MNEFTAFLRTRGVSIVWISAVFSPVLLIMGIIEDKQWHVVVGCALLLLVAWSIMDGIRALKHQMTINFVGSALVPLVSLAFGTLFAILRYVNSG
ncbi:MAG: hypothetical protein QNJ69_03460 [Gammaproteobacteria bacterium]|nr:hypothetical protein [Gammaproteobacteria bacterium]